MKHHGYVYVPREVTRHADTIKLENYKTNRPGEFKVHALNDSSLLTKQLADITGVPPALLDLVYFSCCKGAEPHTDQLDPKKFTGTTFVIPVILPPGRAVIHADDGWMEVALGGVYEFDHTRTHSMTLANNDSGCVVIMAGVLQKPVEKNLVGTWIVSIGGGNLIKWGQAGDTKPFAPEDDKKLKRLAKTIIDYGHRNVHLARVFSDGYLAFDPFEGES